MMEQIENYDNDSFSEEKELPNIPIDIKSSEEVQSDSTIPYAPGSPAYEGTSTNSQENQPNTSSPFAPDMDTELANTPMLIKKPIQNIQGENQPMRPSISPPTSTEPEEKKTILEVEEEKKEGEEKQDNEPSQNNNNQENNNNNSNETKKINL
jgi:hypothetical protein